MEATSLALAVAVTFRELIVISRFVSGALSADTGKELGDLHLQFQHEVLYLHSTYKYFLESRSLLHEQELNTTWLNHVQRILESLRKVSSDYAAVASKYDATYRQNIADASLTNGQLPISELEHQISSISISTGNIRTSPMALKKVVSWIVSDRQKLLDTVKKYRKWNGRLKDLMFLSFAVNPPFEKSQLREIELDETSREAGLDVHILARLRLSVIDPPSQSLMLERRVEMDALSQIRLEGPLTRGILRRADPRRFVPTTQVIIEHKYYDPMPADLSEEEKRHKLNALEHKVAHLSVVLESSSLSRLLTLNCLGYAHNTSKHCFELVLGMPEEFVDTKAQTLFAMIKETRRASLTLPSLDSRYTLASKMAQTLGAFHAVNWVHKSIRSDSVILPRYEDAESDSILERPFLAGFEFSRTAAGPTDYTSDDDLKNNLYRHPDRQGPPQTAFAKAHDVYSLGVVLLEIGLWSPIVSMYEQSRREADMGPEARKAWILHTADKYLAHRMGKSYTNVVKFCLEIDTEPQNSQLPLDYYREVIVPLNAKKLSLSSG